MYADILKTLVVVMVVTVSSTSMSNNNNALNSTTEVVTEDQTDSPAFQSAEQFVFSDKNLFQIIPLKQNKVCTYLFLIEVRNKKKNTMC